MAMRHHRRHHLLNNLYPRLKRLTLIGIFWAERIRIRIIQRILRRHITLASLNPKRSILKYIANALKNARILLRTLGNLLEYVYFKDL